MSYQSLAAVEPYYDDFDPAKNFHRILFRPGYAVQARELTQIQSILQNQIKSLGDFVLENGSPVHGGHLTFDNAAKSLQLQPTQPTSFQSTVSPRCSETTQGYQITDIKLCLVSLVCPSITFASKILM